jgi:hypothetical protein
MLLPNYQYSSGPLAVSYPLDSPQFYGSYIRVNGATFPL